MTLSQPNEGSASTFIDGKQTPSDRRLHAVRSQVFWLQRPPIARYIAAGLLVSFAAWVELRPIATVERPFVSVDVAAGTVLDDSVVEWREVPPGALPAIQPRGVAAISIPAGTPLTEAVVVQAGPGLPEGWWTMELMLSPDTSPGTDLQLVVIPGPGEDPVPPIPAIVVRPGSTPESFGTNRPGLVAVPPDRATDAAIAAAGGRLTVLAAG